jgi:hypothetical protein
MYDVPVTDSPEPTTPRSCDAPKWGPLLIASDVATYLKCNVSTVYDLVNVGRLKAISLMGNVDRKRRGKKGLRILASSVDELVTLGLEERTGPGPSPGETSKPSPALPRPPSRPTRPDRARGSRVLLPYPGGTR